MGESYNIPGRQCLVDEFVQQERTTGQSAWKAFCDCNFLEPVETTVVKLGGMVLPRPPFMSEDAFAQMVRTSAAQKNLPVTVEVSFRLVRTEEWKKCVDKFCTLPTGCWNNDSNDWMPFNMHPGAALAPWTDLGAAARGIYKKDAGFFYTVGQIFSIDLKAYQPLTLWRNFFENPPVYWLNVAKLNLIPGVGTAIASAITASTPANLTLLLPLALTQAAAEHKSAMQYVFKPMVTGSVKYAAFCLRAVPALFAQSYFEFAGMLAARFAQDQIDTGEIDKVLDPFTKAVIVFFAKTGEEVGRELQKIITGGFNLSSAPGVISVLISGFDAVAALPNIDAKVRDFVRSVSNVLKVVRTIAEGIQRKDSPFTIADAVVFEIFGFSLDQLQQAVKQGAAEVQRLLNVAKAKGKEGTLDGALKAFDAILAAFAKISDTITFINNAIGGGLEQFRSQFSGFAVVLGDVKSQTNGLLAQTTGQAITGTGTGATGGSVTPVNIGPEVSVSKNPAGTALIGAGVGAAAGGPLGAAIGGVLGLILGGGKTVVQPSAIKTITLPTMQKDTAAVKQSVSPRGSAAAGNASKVLGFGDFVSARRYGAAALPAPRLAVPATRLLNSPATVANPLPLAQRQPAPVPAVLPPPRVMTPPPMPPLPVAPPATPRTGPIVPDTSRAIIPPAPVAPIAAPAPVAFSPPRAPPALPPMPMQVAPPRLPAFVQQPSSTRIFPPPSADAFAQPGTSPASPAAFIPQGAQAAPQSNGFLVAAGLFAVKLLFF